MTAAFRAADRTDRSCALRRLVALACVAALSACGTAPKRGGYYQDDGPPDRAPADLAQAPDAVPRVEPDPGGPAGGPGGILGVEVDPRQLDAERRRGGRVHQGRRARHRQPLIDQQK